MKKTLTKSATAILIECAEATKLLAKEFTGDHESLYAKRYRSLIIEHLEFLARLAQDRNDQALVQVLIILVGYKEVCQTFKRINSKERLQYTWYHIKLTIVFVVGLLILIFSMHSTYLNYLLGD
jgi:hypothetical protein